MKSLCNQDEILRFHLGIYAIIEKEQSILLVKKSRGPYQGMWDLPGGRPIHGESIIQTLQREVKEETGVIVADIAIHTNQSFVVAYKEGEKIISLHHTSLIYKATRFDASLHQENIVQEDVQGCFWIEKSRLPDLPTSKLVCYI